MPDHGQHSDIPKGQWKRFLLVLWGSALAAAAINAVFVLHRAPILSRQNSVGGEHDAQMAAHWLAHQPAGYRLLLLRPHTDYGVWFNYRLNYLIYPRRHNSAWDQPPEDAESRYDLIISIGTTKPAVTSHWIATEHSGLVTLWLNGTQNLSRSSRTVSRLFTPTILSVLRALLGVCAIIALGCLLLGWTCSESPFDSWIANLAVAHLVGAAAITWTATISCMLFHRITVWPTYLVTLILLPRFRRCIAIVLRPDGSIDRLTGEISTRRFAFSRFTFIPAGLIAIGVLMWVVNGLMLGVGWDGFAIWQFKAQAFLVDGNLSVLNDMHYLDYAHMDYPLLVPAQTWWVGKHAGGYSELWTQASGALFAIDMAVLFVFFASRWVRYEFVLIGVAILVTLPILATHAVSGFADIEMACWFLALAVFIARVSVCGEDRQVPVLCWLFAGIVLVKNEGIMAAVCGLAVMILLQQQNGLKHFGMCASALVVSYLPWFVLKRNWNLKNDLLEGGKNPHFTLSLVIWRLSIALWGFVQCLMKTGPRAGGWGLLILLLPVGLVCTFRRRIAVCTPLWLLCAAQLAGYVLIYLITPHALQEHIGSSVERLTLHVVPTILLASLIASFGETVSSGVNRD
jgi:hypothetical protein